MLECVIILRSLYKNFMRKRNLIFPLIVCSLFMPPIEALVRTTDLNALEDKNNLHQAVDIYIAGNTGGGGGGGGGGKNPIDKKKEAAQKALRALDFYMRKEREAIAKGEDPTEWTNKALQAEDRAIKLDPTLYPSFRMLVEWEKKNKRPNSPQKPQNPNEGLDIPIGERGNPAGKSQKDRLTIKDNKKIRDCKEAVEYYKTDNKEGYSTALRELRKKVLTQKEKLNNIQQPKKVDFSEFLDNKYASLKKLDLMERHIVLLISEYKKIDAVLKNRKRKKYSPNINEVKKQLKVLQGIDLIDDKYLSSLNKDFILLKGDYSPRTINYMKKCN